MGASLSCGRPQMEQFAPIPEKFKHSVYTFGNFDGKTLNENLPRIPFSYTIRDAPTAGLGDLDAFPVELMQQIIGHLDLRSLTNLRYVNRRAEQLVDSVPEYKVITKHARNALRGILAIDTGSLITCTTLYRTLCTYKCEQCGDFGDYLYLFTCKRVCFRCLSEHDDYLPMSRNRARLKFALPREAIKKLPLMRVIPGTYTIDKIKVSRSPSTVLVDPASARRAGLEWYGSSAVMDRRAERLQARNEARKVGPPRRPRPGSVHPYRLMAVCRAPWLRGKESSLQKVVDWGFRCSGCFLDFGPAHYHNSRRRFTDDTFEEHLQKFGEIRDRRHLIVIDDD